MRAILHDAEGRLTIGEVSQRSPTSHEILVKTAASGVNRADLLQKKGHYPPPEGASEVLGLEVSGTVVEVGSAISHFEVGDKVMGLLAGGGYAAYVTDDAGLFVKIPKPINLIDAAAIPEVFLTAYQVLFQLADLQKGEKVLIHAGASGLGTAAIQLAKNQGAKVFVTAGSTDKIAFCQNLGADVGINYKLEDFEEVVKAHGGVDVVLDVVGGGHFRKNLSVLKTDGRYLVVAFMDGAKTTIDLSVVLRKRIRLVGTTLRARSLTYKRKLIEDFLSVFGSHFHEQTIRPVIDAIFPYQDVEAAHRMMSSNQNKGKILLSWS